jgi:hypothetical protein
MPRFCSKQATRGLHGLRRVSAMRPLPRFRSCSIDITAYHLAVIEQRDALTAAEGKGTFWKQKLPIDRDQAEVRAVLSFESDLDGHFGIAATDDDAENSKIDRLARKRQPTSADPMKASRFTLARPGGRALGRRSITAPLPQR